MKKLISILFCVVAFSAAAQFKPTPYDTNSDAVARAFVAGQIGAQVGPSGSNFLNAAGVGTQIGGSNYLTAATAGTQIGGSNYIAYATATIYNVKASPFNATGDGSTDDTLSVSNAIYSAGTNGGIVLIPQGTYKLTSGMVVTNNPIWILGEGAASRIAPSGNFDVFRFSGNTRGCIVSGLFINGTNMSGGNVFTVTNSHRITFRDITGEFPFQVFSIESCNTCTIGNVWMDKVQGAWFLKWFGDDANRSDILQMVNVTASGGTTNTDGIIWDGNCNSMDIQNAGLVTMNYGLHILKSAGSNTPAFLFAHGMQIDFPNREAVRIESGVRYNFSDCYMHGSTLEYGVFLTNGVSQVTISGGNIDGHQKGGILVQSTNTMIVGVHVYNNSMAGANSYPGILVTNGGIVTITGSRISGANQQYGVRSESSTRPVVVGDDLTGNATGDFLDNGGTMIMEFEMPQRPFFSDANTYLAPRANNISTLVVSANKLYMAPLWVTEMRTFTNISLGEVSSALSGNVKIGIYSANRITGHPTTLIVDGGSISTGTTGTKTATISVTLNPGMYFVACVFSAAPTVHSINSDGLGVGMNAGVTAVSGISRSFTFAALPADETSQTYSTENGFVPAVGIR
jgi:hypothetical protein